MEFPVPDFTWDELISLLEGEDQEPGVTTKEIALKWGIVPTDNNLKRVRIRLDRLERAGVITVELAPWKSQMTRAGYAQLRPAYRIRRVEDEPDQGA